jgi:hypothetical protein
MNQKRIRKRGGSEGPKRINVYDPIHPILRNPTGPLSTSPLFQGGGRKGRSEGPKRINVYDPIHPILRNPTVKPFQKYTEKDTKKYTEKGVQKGPKKRSEGPLKK